MGNADVRAPEPARLGWLDANRVFAATGVVLIHSTCDTDGEVFSSFTTRQRVVPAVLRAVAELSGSEIFIVFSMFLIAFKLSKQEIRYGAVVRDQATKLFVPFLAWTFFYAFFRLGKAGEFGYSSVIFTQLGTWRAWLGYLVLGSAQYHLHFVPTMFGVVLMYPLFLGAVRFPALGTAVIASIFVLDTSEGWMWGHVKDPVLREYLIRGLRILAYSGYGAAAFALFGIWKRGLDRADSKLFFRSTLFLLGLATLATYPYIANLALTGHWGVRSGGAFYGHFFTPVLVLAAFMGAQYFDWSKRFGQLAKYTYGVYLVHPIFIDAFDIGVHKLGWRLEPTVTILVKFLVVVPLAFGLSYLLAKTPVFAWTIGLQEKKKKSPKAIAVVSREGASVPG